MRRLAAALAGLLPLATGCPPPEEAATLRLRGVTVVSDDNVDGLLNPGESARLRVEVQVGGEARTLRCDVVSETPGVTVSASDARLSFGYCRGPCADDVAVQVSAQVPPGAVARFRCDTEGGTLLAFEMPIDGADVELQVESLRVTGDDNADGVLNPGESAELRVGLRNLGTSTLTGSRCVVGALTPGVDVSASDDGLQYYRCAAGADCGESSFRVAVAPAVEPGTVARFRCALVDGQEATWPIELSARVDASAARPLFDGYRTDGDRPLAPGYRGALRVRLQNVGPSALTAAACEPTSDVDWLEVTSSDRTLRYYRCAPDGDCGEDGVSIRVAEDAPAGGRATLACDLVDTLEQTWPLTLEVALSD